MLSLSAQSDNDAGTHQLQVRTYLVDYPNVEVIKTIEVHVYAIEYEALTPTYTAEAVAEESQTFATSDVQSENTLVTWDIASVGSFIRQLPQPIG